MMKLGVIGTGYVGLVSAVCFADVGNQVICVDNNRAKIEMLKKGKSPIYEPGIEKLLAKNMKAKRIRFSHSIKEATEKSDIVFICVGTPTSATGAADLSAVANVASEIAKAMKTYKIIVGKSTVPAETGERIKNAVKLGTGGKIDFDIVSNPEFLREGQAIHDTMNPDRIVIGVESKRAEETMRRLYKPFNAPIVVTNIQTAEIIKHASNSFLSTKISYINAIANICEALDADVEKVAEGMGLDKRIGRQFLNAGAGFGGYCFPKDLDAFINLAEKKGYDFEILKAVRKVNAGQRDLVVKKVEDALWIVKGKTIGVWGISFKPETDDTRNSISLDIIGRLQKMGAKIRAYDPQAMKRAKAENKAVQYCKDLYSAAKGADCLLIMTEWNEFRKADMKKVKALLNQPVIVDGRNLFDPVEMLKLGFTYRCIGRPAL
jgi:UDPglucose 6-dehydrogenase